MITKEWKGLTNYYVYGKGDLFRSESLNLAKKEFMKRKRVTKKGDYLTLGVEYDNQGTKSAVDILVLSKGILRVSDDYKYSKENLIEQMEGVVQKVKRIIC